MSETTPHKNRIPFLYLEHGVLGVTGSALSWRHDKQETEIPTGRISCLLLGPGTSVSHAAVALCAKSECLIQWVGAEGSRIYAAGDPITGRPERIRLQAILASHPKSRLRVARYMFERRFGTPVAKHLDVQTIMGMEGGRVRRVYQKLARESKVSWARRETHTPTDPLNKMLNWSNGMVTQTATVAILAAGYSPAIGFVHQGFNRAFACDIADLYKFETSVPLSFRMFSQGRHSQKEVRQAIRDLISKKNIINDMILSTQEVIDAGSASK